MPLYIAKSGDLEGCHACLTDSLTHSHLKDRATQLLIKYKSGALVTQYSSGINVGFQFVAFECLMHKADQILYY